MSPMEPCEGRRCTVERLLEGAAGSAYRLAEARDEHMTPTMAKKPARRHDKRGRCE